MKRRKSSISVVLKRPILAMLCLAFLGITVYSGYKIVYGLRDYKIGVDAYDALETYIYIPSVIPSVETKAETTDAETQSEHESADSVTDPDSTDDVTESISEEKADEPSGLPVVDFEGLYSINGDVAAWIYLEGSAINYPVVQGNDNEFYLNHLVDGRYNSSGSIFIDFRNNKDFGDRHTVLYGHHMNNGTMFNAVAYYKDQAYYNSHRSCLIITPETTYKVSFFAGHVAGEEGDAWKIEFSSDEEYMAWINSAIEKSTFKSGIVPTADDRVITLSTCSYEFEGARYVLLGVLEDLGRG